MFKKVETISPGDLRYKGVVEALRQQKSTRIDYDAVAEQYNIGSVNSYTIVSVNRTTSIGNFTKVLHGRGLIRYIDFDLVRQKITVKGNDIPAGQRPIIITKLTEKTMT